MRREGKCARGQSLKEEETAMKDEGQRVALVEVVEGVKENAFGECASQCMGCKKKIGFYLSTFVSLSTGEE